MAPFFVLRAPLCADTFSTQFLKTNRLAALGGRSRGDATRNEEIHT